jgi:hypothetical protein
VLDGRLLAIVLDGRRLAIVLDGRLVVIVLGRRPDDILPGALTLGLDGLLELLRLGGLEVLTLVRGAVARGEGVDLGGRRIIKKDDRAWGAADLLLAGWLFRPPPPDLLLLFGACFAMTGSMNSIKAKISVTKAILRFPRYFMANMIYLLSFLIILK